MFGTKHSKTNQFQKTVKYKTNEQITKYSNWNMQMQIQPGKISTQYSFFVFTCLYQVQLCLKLYWAKSMQLVSH